MLSPKYVNTKDLREQINLINPILGEAKIKTFGVKKGELVEAFLKAIDSIPAGQEKELGLPDSVTLFYNGIVEGTDPVTETKVPKVPKEKKVRAPGVATKVGTNANEAVAEKLVREGATEEQFAEAFRKIYAERGVVNEEFIAGRTVIYLRIGQKRASTTYETTQDPNLPDYEPGTPVPGEEELTGVASTDPTDEPTE